jgi:phosphoadenosine phosphosulfate reductase
MTPTLRQRLDQARLVVDEALDTYPTDKVMIAWSAGKDSTLVLKLVLDACRARQLKPPVALDIDQKDALPELESFRDRLVREWGVELLMIRNTDVLDRVNAIGDEVRVDMLNATNQATLKALGFHESNLRFQPDSPACNLLLKIQPLHEAIVKHDIRALFTGIRWDEHPARSQETYFSPRENPPHTRVHPLLHLTERDIWDITFALQLPFCPLYIQGFRSLSTRSASKPSTDVPAWEQDLEHTGERDGRSPEKEKMMEQLRELGYM